MQKKNKNVHGWLHTIFPKKVRESYQLLICGNMRLQIMPPASFLNGAFGL